MSSPQVIDSEKRIIQLNHFLRQKGSAETALRVTEAQKKDDKFISLLRAGNADPGTILSHKEIEKRLKRLNPNLIFMQSIAYPEQGGIYFSQTEWNPTDDPFYRSLKMIAAMGWGMVPERTIGKIWIDENGDTKGEISKKGWRTTLCSLIELKLITLSGAEREFGSGGEGWYGRFH